MAGLEDNWHRTNNKIRTGRDEAEVALDRPRASPAWGGLASWAGSGGGRVRPVEGEDAREQGGSVHCQGRRSW
jgi:hypothetical protein